MTKKKAIKIISASTIAASAFVATSSIEAASVSEVEKLVKAAKEAGTILKWAISIEGKADGTTRPWAAYNAAKTAYDKAVKAVNTLPASQKNRYMAELDEHVKLHISRTMYYIDAITAGEKIRAKQQVLANQINKNLINDDTEMAYHDLSREIRKQAILLDRVYGKSTRDLIRSNYKQAAERVRDSAMYAVTVKIEIDLAQKAIAANNFAKADKHIEAARFYLPYVDNPVIKKTLTDRLNSIGSNFTPKVGKVSASEPKRIKVEFNKTMLSGNGANGAENIGNYSVSGRSIKSVKLSDTKKTAIIELYEPLYTNSAYTVTLKKNIQTTNYEPLGREDYISSFTFSDTIKPTVSAVATILNGNVEITFSELIDGNSPLNVSINGKAVKFNSLSNETDKVVVPKSELEKIGLQKGKYYSIVVSGARDLVAYTPNTMNTYSSNFLYNPAADSIAPTVSSLQVKDEKTLTIEFSEPLADFSAYSHLVITKGNSTFRAVSIKDISDGRKTKFDIELPTNIYNTNDTSVYLYIQVKSFKDLDGNTGRTYERSVTMTKDLTPPRFVSAQFDKNTNEFRLTLNKPLKAGTPSADKINISYKGSTITPTFKSNRENQIIIDASKLKDGTYNISVSEGAVKDRSISGNNNSAFTTSITKKLDSEKPKVTFSEASGNGVFTAEFNEDVDAGTATLYSNYFIGNSTIPSNSTLTLSSNQREVTITLPEGAIPTTTKYSITAKGVKDLSDNTMDSYTSSITLTDNTQPLLKSAAVDNENIKLTFSENILLFDGNQSNLDITVNNEKLKPDQFNVQGSSNKNELFIIPQNGTTFTTGDIIIVTRETAAIKDDANNTLKAGTEITIKK